MSVWYEKRKLTVVVCSLSSIIAADDCDVADDVDTTLLNTFGVIVFKSCPVFVAAILFPSFVLFLKRNLKLVLVSFK